MLRLSTLAMLTVLIASCNDHVEEIAKCQKCDTLINLRLDFEDTALVQDGDTVVYVLKKAPQFSSTKVFVVLQNGQKEICICDTIRLKDSLLIQHKGRTHVYYNFKKDWYFMATMSDHNDGRCGLHDYVIDGIEVVESGTVLSFPK